MGDIGLATEKFLKNHLLHPFYYEGWNSADHNVHIQLADESDVEILKHWFEVCVAVTFDWADGSRGNGWGAEHIPA